MRLLKIVPLLLAGYASVASAASNNQAITASQLLDKFAATQTQLKSFIIQIEGSIQDKISSPQKRNDNSWFSSETRFDGHRICVREYMWGRIIPRVQRSKEKPYYKSTLFDGQRRFNYDIPFWDPADAANPNERYGHVIIGPLPHKPNDLIQKLHIGSSPFEGFLGVLPYDGERIDVRLRQCPALQLRRNLEAAGYARSLCYVLEGDTPRGYYTVWLDPAHGFQLAKGTLRRDPGHLRGSAPIQPGDSDYTFVDNVRFAKFGETWVPVGISCGLDVVILGRNSRESRRYQAKVTKLLLNPATEALGSFVPDDIRNGALVHTDPFNGTHGGLLRGYWRDGKMFDKAGKLLLTASPELFELRSKANEPLLNPNATKMDQSAAISAPQ